MTERILVPLAEGFEEIEAVTIIDVLRRAGLEVTVAGLSAGVLEGSRGVRVEPDVLFSDIDPETFDAIILPGGMGGTLHLMKEERLLDGLRRLHAGGKVTAAICAAPMVLAEAGLAEGVPMTSHPSVRGRLGGADVQGAPRVLKAGSLITSQGAGTAMEFALALVAEFCGEAKRAELAEAMVVG